MSEKGGEIAMLAICGGRGRHDWARAEILLLEFNLGEDVKK
jgi:hypothetical protein